LIKPITHWDVEVGDFAVVEHIASWGLIEGVLVVEDSLFKVVESVFILLVGYAGAGLSIGDGLQKAIGDASE
jgi:hypothetical protein